MRSGQALSRQQGGRLVGDWATWRRVRFGWLESVRRDTSLSSTARLVAHVLVMDFCNNDTMRCDPSYDAIRAVVGGSRDTIRRAVSDLATAGWIRTEGGCGRGVSRGYGFLTRAEIIPLKGSKIAPQKGSTDATLCGSEKVANLPPKGSKNATAYNNDINHKKTIARAWARGGVRVHARLSDNPMVISAAERVADAVRRGRLSAPDGEPVWVLGHLLAAALLTDAELEAAGFEFAEKGRDDG